MLISLVYVSRSLLILPDQAGEVGRIVDGSCERNAKLEVRGALIFTERHFAQLLEGPEHSIDALMDSIGRDTRHEHVTVIERREIDGYRFPDWSLSYWGNAGYIDRQVARVMEKVRSLGRTEQGSDLFTLIQRMAIESHKEGRPIGRPSSH